MAVKRALHLQLLGCTAHSMPPTYKISKTPCHWPIPSRSYVSRSNPSTAILSPPPERMSHPINQSVDSRYPFQVSNARSLNLQHIFQSREGERGVESDRETQSGVVDLTDRVSPDELVRRWLAPSHFPCCTGILKPKHLKRTWCRKYSMSGDYSLQHISVSSILRPDSSIHRSQAPSLNTRLYTPSTPSSVDTYTSTEKKRIRSAPPTIPPSSIPPRPDRLDLDRNPQARSPIPTETPRASHPSCSSIR